MHCPEWQLGGKPSLLRNTHLGSEAQAEVLLCHIAELPYALGFIRTVGVIPINTSRCFRLCR